MCETFLQVSHTHVQTCDPHMHTLPPIAVNVMTLLPSVFRGNVVKTPV